MPKIKSYKFVGEEDAYDLEVAHPDHQFYTSDGILTSNSHAVAYAIDSYFAAWLFTYYPTEWLATILQSENTNPDNLSKAINEIKRLGYKIGQLDVNHSGFEWVFSDEIESFVPPLSSLKGVGDTAAQEIMETRPFRDIRSLLFDKEGNWYHSKMNKTAFDSLCKSEAFGSLREMQDGTLDNHRQLHEIIVGNYQVLRKGIKGLTKSQIKKLEKQGESPPDITDTLIREVKELEDWSRIEKVLYSQELTSAVSNELLFPEGLLEKLEEKKIIPVTRVPGGQKAIAWFLTRDLQEKKTKNGKVYYRIRAQDDQNNLVWLKVWGKPNVDITLFSVWICEATGDEQWGPSTSAWKIRPIVD